MSTVLLTGARGLLGQALAHRLRPVHRLIEATRDGRGGTTALDVTDRDAVARAISALRPDWIVNAAAYTAVDRAEAEPLLAQAVNAVAPRHLAEVAKSLGARLLHISTDFVFDGAKTEPYVESDATNPISVYGRTKRDGEDAVREVLPDTSLVVRVAWSFGPGGKNFVSTILDAARAGRSLRVVDDQVGTPTFTSDAARLLAHLMDRDARGLFHLANQGTASWYELAVTALRLAGVDAAVTPIASDAWPSAARRPRNSALSNANLRGRGAEDPMRPWREALAIFVAAAFPSAS